MGNLGPLLLRVPGLDELDCCSPCRSSSSASSSKLPLLVDLHLAASTSLTLTLGSTPSSLIHRLDLLQNGSAVRSNVPPTMAPVALWCSSSATASSATTLNSSKLSSSPRLSSLASATSSCTLSTAGRLSRLAIISLGQQLQMGRNADRLRQPARLTLSNRHA